MTLTKQFLKSRPTCKVTFRMDRSRADGAETVRVVGEFNDWNPETPPMERLKNGDFKTTLELPTGRAYQFRYLLDGSRWENDDAADRYERNAYGEENSVVEC